jgi:hypothetical protein
MKQQQQHHHHHHILLLLLLTSLTSLTSAGVAGTKHFPNPDQTPLSTTHQPRHNPTNYAHRIVQETRYALSAEAPFHQTQPPAAASPCLLARAAYDRLSELSAYITYRADLAAQNAKEQAVARDARARRRGTNVSVHGVGRSISCDCGCDRGIGDDDDVDDCEGSGCGLRVPRRRRPSRDVGEMSSVRSVDVFGFGRGEGEVVGVDEGISGEELDDLEIDDYDDDGEDDDFGFAFDFEPHDSPATAPSPFRFWASDPLSSSESQASHHADPTPAPTLDAGVVADVPVTTPVVDVAGQTGSGSQRGSGAATPAEGIGARRTAA